MDYGLFLDSVRSQLPRLPRKAPEAELMQDRQTDRQTHRQTDRTKTVFIRQGYSSIFPFLLISFLCMFVTTDHAEHFCLSVTLVYSFAHVFSISYFFLQIQHTFLVFSYLSESSCLESFSFAEKRGKRKTSRIATFFCHCGEAITWAKYRL